MTRSLCIAVDFDGTIVDHEFPKIGKTKPFAFEALKELEKKGHRLILWTYRHGEHLDAAVEFCKENGIEFYAVNKSYPEEQFDPETTSRKLDCDMFIDDRDVSGFIGWGEIFRKIHPEEGGMNEEMKAVMEKGKKKGILGKLFGF